MRSGRKPDRRPQARRLASILLLTLFAVAILILGGLVVYLGSDLWVLVNTWMQTEAGKA